MTTPYPEGLWIVDGIFRIGRKRLSLITGEPGSGKSTLSHQLAVAVAKGIPFLARETVKSDVLIWQTEEEPADLQVSLKRLGYDHERDGEITAFNGSPSENTLLHLHQALDARPNVRLVLIETLDALLKMEDSNSNTAARVAFDKFDEQVGQHFNLRTCFVGLCYENKKKSANKWTAASGATTISGRADGSISVEVVSQFDDRRVLSTRTRHGRSIPPTYLNFEPSTGISTLGQRVEEEKKANAEKSKEHIEEQILTYFANHPDTSYNDDCAAAITGRDKNKDKVFARLLRSGRLVKIGKGVKGSKGVYRLSESIPVESLSEVAA